MKNQSKINPSKILKNEDEECLSLLKHAKSAMLRVMPPEEYGEDYDCEELYNCIEALQKIISNRTLRSRPVKINHHHNRIIK